MLVDWLFVITTVCCWLAAAGRLRNIRHAPDRLAVAALASALAALGAATALQIRPMAALLNSGAVDTAKLASHSSILLGAFCAQVVLVAALVPTRSRAYPRIGRRAAILTACVTGMTVLVLAAPADLPVLRAADGVPLPTATGAGYVTLYAGYLGAAAFDIARMGFRFARLADRVFLRLGMLTVGAGASAGVGYAIIKVTLVAGRLAGVQSAELERILLTPVVIGSVLLVTAGSALPAMASNQRLQPAVRWLTQLWTYYRLRPLWERLVRAGDVPQLLPSPSLVKATWYGLSLRFVLQRRVTEISDGLLRLRTRADPAVAATAADLARRADLPAGERHAVIQAAAITSALAATAPATGGRLPEPPPFRDPDRKAWWLQQVANAMNHSPIVRAAVAAPHTAPPTVEDRGPE